MFSNNNLSFIREIGSENNIKRGKKKIKTFAMLSVEEFLLLFCIFFLTCRQYRFFLLCNTPLHKSAGDMNNVVDVMNMWGGWGWLQINFINKEAVSLTSSAETIEHFCMYGQLVSSHWLNKYIV